ncbi:MAG: M20/M25/M40 family metallo-hydrolase [Candidatus Aminicenantes bacterium]|nr:M20/M25/M40 family metallo-hydrolase [Candidatus Aminicenantes bacterium]
MNKRSVQALLALALVLFSFRSGTAGLQNGSPSYRQIVDRLRDAGLAAEHGFELLKRITSVGPRLTGSPEAAAAVELSLRLMKELGFANVHMEPVEVGHWVRGDVGKAEIIASGTRAAVPLALCALGGSVGTPEGGLAAPVVEVRSLDEVGRLGPKLGGKIVFFNRPMDRRLADSFSAYGGAADQRVNGASAAARHGAVGVLVRSLTFREDANPHTGLMQYDPRSPRIPAAAVSTRDAEILSALLKEEQSVSVSLRLNCRDMGKVTSANIVGELTGTELPDEIILLSGHLDSWDLSVGAHDDGAGCAASLEALRLIMGLGLRPRRTIRAVLFMDEEFGGTGGRAYVRAPERKGERHLVAAESDRGGFAPVGLTIGRRDSRVLKKISSYADLFRPLGISFIAPGGGGVDVAPLIEKGAEPAAVMINAQAYFDVHHSALDVVSSVHPRELELQAVILAALAYILAQEGI